MIHCFQLLPLNVPTGLLWTFPNAYSKRLQRLQVTVMFYRLSVDVSWYSIRTFLEGSFGRYQRCLWLKLSRQRLPLDVSRGFLKVIPEVPSGIVQGTNSLGFCRTGPATPTGRTLQKKKILETYPEGQSDRFQICHLNVSWGFLWTPPEFQIITRDVPQSLFWALPATDPGRFHYLPLVDYRILN